jgi:hypothetical protein
MAVILLAACLLLGCSGKQDPKPDESQASQSTNTGGQNVTPPGGRGTEVDLNSLPKDGPGDSALSYDVVSAGPVKYRGKRVTWVFAPLSAEGKRMMCALDMKDAMGPRHSGIYVVEFASDREAGDAFQAAAFKPGSTITGTVAGQIDQFLVIRGRDGVPQKDIPKVTVPLLVHPAYKAGEPEGDKGRGKD